MQNLSAADLAQLEQKGITVEKLQEQIEEFKTGFPYARLIRPALRGDGIYSFTSQQIAHYRALYQEEAPNETVVKFVPASGAATRMFKNLYALYENLKAGIPVKVLKPEVKEFFTQINKFAFYDMLASKVKELTGKDLDSLIEQADYLPVLDVLLENPQGMEYGKLPKALLLFHNYEDGPRVALEEHLVEAALYASAKGVCRLHFTISPEHKDVFQARVAEVISKYEKRFNLSYQITYSEQKPKTDTLAVTLQNEPYRDEDGRLVFRPGGHGALIENLNDLQADIIFIKNIDNVTTDALKTDTVVYKELLAGVLIDRRRTVYSYLQQIEKNTPTNSTFIHELKSYCIKELSLEFSPNFENLSPMRQLETLRQMLDRPMRVCGVVKNTGEPGGGPFWVLPEGESAASLQIVEASQVDTSDYAQKQIFLTSAFFNPVDLVCSPYNYKHEKYSLPEFVDPSTAFISEKSVKGDEIKAMELPGLWNGAMARWITLFVEVPQSVFTPVKTVNDLLRPQHL